MAIGGKRPKKNWGWFGFLVILASWRWRWRNQPCKGPGSLSRCWSLQEQFHRGLGSWSKEEQGAMWSEQGREGSRASLLTSQGPTGPRKGNDLSFKLWRLLQFWISVWHYMFSPPHWELWVCVWEQAKYINTGVSLGVSYEAQTPFLESFHSFELFTAGPGLWLLRSWCFIKCSI